MADSFGSFRWPRLRSRLISHGLRLPDTDCGVSGQESGQRIGCQRGLPVAHCEIHVASTISRYHERLCATIQGRTPTMQVFGPYRVHTSQPIQGPHRAGSVGSQNAASRSTTPVDRLELSEQARGAAEAAPAGDAPIRAEKVAALRRAIAQGNYDTPDKLDIALERMLGDFS